MPISAGAKLGPYEIVSAIGKGGMGEVWKARDTRLDRTVAIKTSAATFSERFEREARAVAALNHPHICTLYDVGPDYIVMEYVEGSEIKGPLPLDQALKYAIQLTSALEAAHRKGITHRDLKPANILVTKAGVKVLDFGLAKIEERPETKKTDETLTRALTQENSIVGTLQYMAPEQLQGKVTDARADIYSFGCVLYEMLTGRRAFDGSNTASVTAAILERPAPRVAGIAPAGLDWALQLCLAKDPDERWQSARDVRAALEWVTHAEAEVERARPSPRATGLLWTTAGVLALVAAAFGFLYFRQKPPDAPVVRFTVSPPETAHFTFGPEEGPEGFPALSPDGHRLVFGARQAGRSRSLWLRSLDASAPLLLNGTEGGSLPFWSADGHFIGFGANGKLKKMDLSGGPAVSLADAPSFRGASWSPQGVILFAPARTGALLVIPAAGGVPTPSTVLDPSRKEQSHRWPWFLPDGRHFLYSAVSSDGEVVTSDSTIYAGSVDSRERRIVAQASSNAVYAAGYLLFLRENTLMAQPFDAKRLATTGEAVVVAEQVADSPESGRGFFSAIGSDMLAFQSGLQSAWTLAWLDRAGKRVAVMPDPGMLIGASLSPDGKRATVSVYDRAAHNNDIWIYDLTRNVRSRFTFGSANEFAGVWSPDGTSIVFNSSGSGHLDLYRKSASGMGAEELLYADELSKAPTSWSPDGKLVMYNSFGDPKTRADIWVLPFQGEPKPVPFLKTSFNEYDGRFSPDGKWVAYTSDESGRAEVYICPFPGAGGKRLVSSAGGDQAHWRADGKELFYVAPDGRMLAAEVNIKGTDVQIGTVRPLFGPLLTTGYDVSSDGQRFLAVLPEERAAAPDPLTVVLNWTAGLKK